MDTYIKEYVNKELNKSMPTILEIGAHYGEDTIDMLKVFVNPVIHCFEPDPRNFAFLEKQFYGHNHTKGYVHLYNVALFNQDGEKDFYMSYAPYPEDKPLPKKYQWIGEEDYRQLKLNGSGGSSLKLGGEEVRNAESVKVRTMKLDTWHKGIMGNIDFIWMDVQGAEREVIEGGKLTLSKTSFIWLEFGEVEYEGGMTKEQTCELLSELDFTYIMYRDNNLLFRGPICKSP